MLSDLFALPLSWPVLAIVAGVLLLAWNRGGASLKSWLARRATAQQDLGPQERFARFYDLRQWCESAGQTEAIAALDSSVLPAIVRDKVPQQ